MDDGYNNTLPMLRNNMNTVNKWSQPVILSDLDVAFGPDREGMQKVLPAMEEIPEDFKAWNGGSKEARKWVQAVDDIFFRGVELKAVIMKPEVDRRAAMKHIQCVLHSFEPSHEHKTAGVAYLMSLWFERFDYIKVEKNYIKNGEKI
jgi:hypothetical protein